MKPFLVDVPVKVNIWIRPECQRKQFEVLKEARPSILFIQSDGGRNDKEWAAIHENRKLFDEGIDWDCTVYKIYEDHNNGLYAMGIKMREVIWEKVDRCITLEDDILPSVSFFKYCAELLERYKDDERIECICGMNHLGISENVNTDYFFSRQGSIWGIATWKRVIDARDNYAYAKDDYVMSLLKQRTKHNPIAWKRLCAYSKNEIYEGHVAGGEFWHEFNMYSQNMLQIVPKKNLICNIGCTNDSEHAASLKQMPRAIRKVFNMKTYELDFPLKHAEYVIPDIEYEKRRNRIMGYNRPLVQLYRNIEVLFLRSPKKNLKSIRKKLSIIFKRNSQLEK